MGLDYKLIQLNFFAVSETIFLCVHQLTNLSHSSLACNHP